MQDQDQANQQNNTQSPNPATAGQVNTPPLQNTTVSTPPPPAGKEHEPVNAPVVESKSPAEQIPEITQSEHPELKISDELKKVAEQGPDAKEPEIPREVVKPLATPAQQDVQVIATPSGNVKLPKTYAQAQQTKKSTATSDSIHWLATLIMYQWRKYDPDSAKEVK